MIEYSAMDIRIQLEDVSSVKKRLKVEVPSDIAQKEFNQVAGQYKKHARLPGFRPGKAPVELVKRHFGKNIRSEVLQNLIPKSYDQAIREQGVQPLGEPDLENLTFQEGEPLVYEANFEIRPSIELSQYKGLKVKSELKTVTEEDVHQELEKLREGQSRLVSVEGRAIKEEDYAVVELHGEYVGDGETGASQEPIREESVVVRVGDEHTHEAFNRALLGMKIAEKKQFEVEYDSEYPEKKLAGHKVLFNLELSDIKRKELPELNDDLAKDFGECDTLDELKVKVREQLTAERETNRDNDLKKELVEQMIDRTDFEVPDVLVEDQTDSMIRDLATQMASEGVDPNRSNLDWMKVRSDFRPEAEKRVRTNMILTEIGNQEKIEINKDELNGELKQMAESMGQPEEKVRQYFQQANRMEGLRAQLVRQKAMDVLLDNAKIKS